MQQTIGTFCRELYKHWTDGDAACVVDSGGSKETLLDGGAHWSLANTTEPSVCGGDTAFFDKLLLPLVMQFV